MAIQIDYEGHELICTVCGTVGETTDKRRIEELLFRTQHALCLDDEEETVTKEGA